MCDADLRKTWDAAREVSYFNKPQQKQQLTFQKRNEPRTRQVNYGYGRPRNSKDYNATRCDSPNTYPMRDIIAPLTSKNGHPSSSL